MEGDIKRSAPYRIIDFDGARRYRFFCEASGMALVTTEPVERDTPEEELEAAWTIGRRFFNRCAKCGRWVCDAMYNADVLHCADCTPWENLPNYCSSCGQKVDITDVYCRRCGSKLLYKEVDAEDG